MRISACKIDRYEAPLKLALPRTNTLTRSGLYVELTLENGKSATGEIAPLHGFSVETLAEAQAQAVELAGTLAGQDVDELTLPRTSLFPSVLSGFELAAVKLATAKLSANNSGWWHSPDLRPDAICVLLDPGQPRKQLAVRPPDANGHNLTDRIRALTDEGFSRFKLKVAIGSIKDDIERIRIVCAAMGERALLRLDANRRWSYEDAVTVLTEIDLNRIEFMEEPIINPDQLSRLIGVTGVSVALDESFESIAGPEPDFRRLRWVKAIVLKPMLRGGYGRSLELARAASACDIGAVISSSFETEVGHEALRRLWSALPEPRLAPGLGTQHYFQEFSASDDRGPSLTRVFPR